MPARYLLRIDDVCPTNDLDRWERVEAAVRAVGARPIVAVIPDNRDPTLMRAPVDQHFWARVRAWRTDGWAIGLHGHRHEYSTQDRGLVGRRPLSEFAGLNYPDQHKKLVDGIKIMREHGVEPDLFVAPGHTFDSTTLAALRSVGLEVLSDGFAIWPHRDEHGMVWLPQQLWSFRWRPAGLWTVCLHVDAMSESDIDSLAEDLQRYRTRLADWQTEIQGASANTRLNRLSAGLVRTALSGREMIAKAMGR